MNLKFGENFKRLRKEKDITQEKIAEVLDVSAQSVSRWELGICYPDLEMLPAIANYFGVTVDSLLSNDTTSREEDLKLFKEKYDELEGEECIEFTKGYCKKYPGDDYYAYRLLCAICCYACGNNEMTEKYMATLLKNADRLLETQYRNATIQQMVCICDEKELDKWLDLVPYSAGFSRRGCLTARSSARETSDKEYIQQGMERFESFVDQLDSRCPDKLGAKLKAEFQQSVLRTVESFGNGDVPDGWKCFYAYKQLVLAACLFGQKKHAEGWREFDSAIEKFKYVFELQDEWLDVGSALFSGIRVNKVWTHAMDDQGNEHKLFGVHLRSFYDAEFLAGFLTNPRWAWFNSVRDTEKYKSAIAWAQEMSLTQNNN